MHLPYSVVLLLDFFILSHARYAVFTSENDIHSNLPSSSEPNVCMTPSCVIAAAEILTNLDETMDPCDNFYRFACGGWLKRHEISQYEWQVSVRTVMRNDLSRQFKELLESKYEDSEPPFVKMLKDFYQTCINKEKDGSEPLKTILSRLGGWPVVDGDNWEESRFDWVDSLISLRKLGYNYNKLIELYTHTRNFRIWAYKIKIGPPLWRITGRSNITLGRDDPNIAAYLKLMVNAAKLLGADESAAEQELLEVIDFAIALEKYIKTENPLSRKMYLNRKLQYTIKELEEKVPQIPWLKYFIGMFNNIINENETVTVMNPSYFTKLVHLINSTEKRVIANFMMMHVVFESAKFLSEDWRNIYSELKKVGYHNDEDDEEKKLKPVWKTCLSIVEDKMALALSSLYIRCCFKKENKDESMLILKYIHKEFLKMLEENDWMDENTKRQAEEKADAMKFYMAYKDDLLNDTFVMNRYKNLMITADSYLENMMSLRKVDIDKELLMIGKPFLSIKKKRWELESFVDVNAYYVYSRNTIIIPAGILDDLFYGKGRPNYLNFGAIGYVFGHEVTHGFDDRGRRFNKDGKRVDWWDEESDKHFTKKVECIVDQYYNYTTDIGLKVNGENTLNENIADIGGIKEAYLAYKSWTKDYGMEPTLPGLNYTQNQLFWLSAAYSFCTKYKPEKLKTMLLSDLYSPGQFRVIGPMSNMEEFSKDFKCSADSPMNRKYKCVVW